MLLRSLELLKEMCVKKNQARNSAATKTGLVETGGEISLSWVLPQFRQIFACGIKAL